MTSTYAEVIGVDCRPLRETGFVPHHRRHPGVPKAGYCSVALPAILRSLFLARISESLQHPDRRARAGRFDWREHRHSNASGGPRSLSAMQFLPPAPGELCSLANRAARRAARRRVKVARQHSLCAPLGRRRRPNGRSRQNAPSRVAASPSALVDRDSALRHHLFQVSKAQGIRHIPANARQDHVERIVQTLEHPCQGWIQSRHQAFRSFVLSGCMIPDAY